MKGNVKIDFHIRILWRPLPFKLHPPDRAIVNGAVYLGLFIVKVKRLSVATSACVI
ncbi:hypothetical protein E1A91_D03G052600v1 [Gossypium mustelinum]|uniref:Uncharacterized protein n=1 Tax=Gossypium mustelinum TaxID=34275 RepID=A0A5D2VJR1_GOSMU|nr:hypothetical protein E1A91_D03G052600v1 [Gossypium mustelinum]